MIGRLLGRLTRTGAVAGIIGAVAAGTMGGDAVASELGLERYGPRLGFSVEPDQVTVGAFADFGRLAPKTHLLASADLGFGDNVTSFLVNGDVAYRFAGPEQTIDPYLGGGLTIAYYNFDIDAPPGVNVDDTETEIGLSLLAGVEVDLGGYKTGSLELRFGIDELPDVKLTAALGFF